MQNKKEALSIKELEELKKEYLTKIEKINTRIMVKKMKKENN